MPGFARLWNRNCSVTVWLKGEAGDFKCLIPSTSSPVLQEAGAFLLAPVCTENLDSDVLMMQPADQGMRHNSSDPLNWARDRRILSQGAMSSRRVVIARIGFYESAQVLLTQCDDMVNTLASDRPNQPFHEAILPRRARRNRLVADTHGS